VDSAYPNNPLEYAEMLITPKLPYLEAQKQSDMPNNFLKTCNHRGGGTAQHSDWATGWTTRVRFLAGPRDLSLGYCVQTGSSGATAPRLAALGRTQPPTQLVPGVEWLRNVANHSPAHIS
jgi:hypothetical protein